MLRMFKSKQTSLCCSIVALSVLGMGGQECQAGHLSGLAGGGFDPAVGFIGEINYQGMNNKFMIMNVSDPNWVLTSLTIDLPDGVSFFNASAASAGSLTTAHNSYDFGGGNTWAPNFAAGDWTAINDNGDTLTETSMLNYGTQVTGQNMVTFTFTGFNAFTGPASGATTAQYDAWGFNTLFTTDGINPLTEGTDINGTVISATFINMMTQEVVSTTTNKSGKGASIPFAAATSGPNINEVPEPASMCLFGLGISALCGFGARNRARRRQAA